MQRSFAKFTVKLSQSIPLLTNVISQGNAQQTGASLAYFVSLANQHATSIQKLVFLDTWYLHRHYRSSDSVSPDTTDALWRMNNQEHLQLLQVPWEYRSWGALIQEAGYAECLDLVQASYHTQDLFKREVDRLVDHYQAKGSSENVRHYLFEECSGSLLLVRQGATITYPGKLNTAIRFITQTYSPRSDTQTAPLFLGYKVVTRPAPKSESKPNAELTIRAKQTTTSLERLKGDDQKVLNEVMVPSKPALLRASTLEGGRSITR